MAMSFDQMKRKVFSEMGKSSQRKRLAKMTPEEISAFARKGALAMWKKRRERERSGIQDAHDSPQKGEHETKNKRSDTP